MVWGRYLVFRYLESWGSGIVQAAIEAPEALDANQDKNPKTAPKRSEATCKALLSNNHGIKKFKHLVTRSK